MFATFMVLTLICFSAVILRLIIGKYIVENPRTNWDRED
jgi:hypothetical protein